MATKDRGVVLVTGAAKRVGRAIALGLAEAGYDIAVHYRKSAAAARETVGAIRALGRRAAAVRGDLTRRGAPERIAAAAARLGPLAGLVASASTYRHVPPEAFGEAEWDFHIETNLKATYLLAVACRKRMEKGAMVFLGDVMGFRPYRNLVSYGVSKAGVHFLARALAKAWAPDVRVNCVAPGPVLPPEGASRRAVEAVRRATPLGYGSPEAVAHAVRFFFENDYTTGAVLAVDGGRDLG